LTGNTAIQIVKHGTPNFIIRDIDFLKDLTMYKIIIDSEKCINCGECVEVCHEEVYALEDEELVLVNEKNCVGCNDCIVICGFEAITLEEE
jgi:NAD-dependent dihydropyrimidine dehydrogenase PreA subunit